MTQIKPPLGARLDGSSPLSRGLVGCWLFNARAGLYVYDVSGLRNTATLSGAANPSTATSGWALGGEMALDGTDDYLSIVTNSYLQPTGRWSICAWVRLASTTTAVCIFSTYAQVAKVAGISFGVNVYAATQHKLSVVQGANTGTGATHWNGWAGATSVDDDKWHFVVATNNGSNAISLYLDGRSDSATRTFGTGANVAPAYQSPNYVAIGAEIASGTPGKYWPGRMNGVRFHNGRTLGPAEVLELYRNPYAGISSPRRRRVYKSTASHSAGFFGFM